MPREQHGWSHNELAADLAEKLRKEARAIEDEAKARGQAAAEAQMASLAQARTDLCRALGLPDDSAVRTIQSRVASLRDRLTMDAARRRLGQALQDIHHMAASVLESENRIAPLGE